MFIIEVNRIYAKITRFLIIKINRLIIQNNLNKQIIQIFKKSFLTKTKQNSLKCSHQLVRVPELCMDRASNFKMGLSNEPMQYRSLFSERN